MGAADPAQDAARSGAVPRADTAVTWLTLLSSSGTLICCTIPIALVSLGFSGAVIALTAHVPFLVPLTRHKLWIFVISAAMLALSGWLLYRPGRACPADPRLAALCNRAQVWNRRVYWFSVILWAVGFFFSYLLLPLSIALNLPVI